MKRLEAKIFLLTAMLSSAVALVAFVVTPRGAFTPAQFLAVLGIAATGALLLSRRLARLLLDPLDEIRSLAEALQSGAFERRLLWSFGDVRDTTAIRLNAMADHLVREIESARREAQQLEAVLGSMVEGVLVLDLEDRIVLVNPGFREVFGIWGNVRDRSLVEVLRNREVGKLIEAAREDSQPVIRDVSVHSGSPRTVMAHATRFPSSGPPAGLIAVFHDVTEIRRVDRVRRDFVANASHELRTPLTSIQGFAETLQKGGLGAEDRARCLETIQRNVVRMRDLIDDLMALSRIEHDGAPLERAPVDALELAHEIVADLQRRFETQRITARIETESAPEVLADRRALAQVIENLVTNAIRYSDPGSEVRLRVESRDDAIEISVADSGIGIPPDALDRIFERFYRVDASRSRAVGSTGLGLSIVRHLVQAMGGTIRVESELGVGSCFAFTVPRAPGAPRTPDTPGTPGEGTPAVVSAGARSPDSRVPPDEPA